MTTTFGGSDAEGAWSWRDAYDAIEAALVLQLRRLGPQIGRLEDAPAEIVALLANLADLSLTHTRRSEEQVALRPVLHAAGARRPWRSLAAQVRPGDQVLEPSAGTGLLAILAEACGGEPDRSTSSPPRRAALLDGLFPAAVAHAATTPCTCATCCPRRAASTPSSPIRPSSTSRRTCTPPSTAWPTAAGCRRSCRRACSTTPAPCAPWPRAGRIVLRLAFPATRLRQARDLGRDRPAGDRPWPGRGRFAAGRRRPRPWPTPPSWRPPRRRRGRPPSRGSSATVHPRRLPGAPGPGAGDAVRPAGLPRRRPRRSPMRPAPGRARATTSASTRPTARPRRASRQAQPHPSPLVESGPMASVAPPAPTYRPVLPPAIAERGPGLRRAAGDGDLRRRGPRQHPAGRRGSSARRRTR